ncbi:hypothetical protein MYMAC_005848 [Corallococcus macrosporus DSM 14697]|uniref:Uncharacterized protein n=1 Tax=Corallococcus macrosporus DSM 14697 TaxID=1189310 RepID=A0A250K2G2_9BACT|nr:hypothetical protein MYMAC_005848 [Corallococcus macrosporus DSM 14697]
MSRVGLAEQRLAHQDRVRARVLGRQQVRGVFRPLSATSTRARVRSFGITRSAVPVSVFSVARSRLLMPTSFAPAASARSACASVWASTNAATPTAFAVATISRSSPSSSASAMSSTASAPHSALSSTSRAATRKSLRSTGSATAARTATRSSSAPPKSGPSVSTLMALAPAAS